MSLIGLFIGLILVLLCVWAVRALLAAFSIGEPISTLVMVIVVILVVLFLIQALGGGHSLGNLRIT
jgi:hypothetical protein